MGSCFSSDSLPPVPKEIKPDPEVEAKVTVVIKCLGSFWGRDFGVWENEYPKSSEDRREKMWLWLNKSTVGNNATIDLENFVRGTKGEKSKDKGRVLYTASFQDTPYFEQSQRIPADSGPNMFFIGIFQNAPNNDDYYYMNHHIHTNKFRGRMGVREEGPGMITKFHLNTHAKILDGDTGRGEAFFGKDPLILEVFSTGTAATTWTHEERRVEDRDQEGRVVGHHIEIDYNKYETEWVDRVEFRLSFKGQNMGTWFINGDAHEYSSDPTLSSPLFNAVFEGGFFKPSLFRVTTNDGYDPALSILVAHLVQSEYSVMEIKKMFHPTTPARAPPGGFGFMGMQMQTYNSPFVQNNAPMWKR